MDTRFPRYFIIAMALYALSLLFMLAYFAVPVLQAGLVGYVDFYIFLLLMVLPLIMLFAYLKTPLGKEHGTAFRLGIAISSVLLSLVFMFVISPLL